MANFRIIKKSCFFLQIILIANFQYFSSFTYIVLLILNKCAVFICKLKHFYIISGIQSYTTDTSGLLVFIGTVRVLFISYILFTRLIFEEENQDSYTELVGEIRCLGLISIVARTGIWKFYHFMWVKWLKQESGNLTS